jgi:hypothetical protein
MNDKLVLLLFLIIWSCSYYIGINSFTEKYYQVKNIKINQENIIIKDKIVSYEYYIIELENNKTCYLGIKNTEIIKNYIEQIEKNKNKYYSNLYLSFNEKTNKSNYVCSEPNTTIGIYFEYLIIHLETLFCSFMLTFIIVNIIKDAQEFQDDEIEYKNTQEKNSKTNFEV